MWWRQKCKSSGRSSRNIGRRSSSPHFRDHQPRARFLLIGAGHAGIPHQPFDRWKCSGAQACHNAEETVHGRDPDPGMKAAPAFVGNCKLTHQPASIRRQSVCEPSNQVSRVSFDKTIDEEMRHDSVVLRWRPTRHPRILAEEIHPSRIARSLPRERNHFRANFDDIKISQWREREQSRNRTPISFAQYKHAPRASQTREKCEPAAFQRPAESRILDPAIPTGEPPDLHRNNSGVSNTASAKTQRTSPEIVRPQRARAASAAALTMMATNHVEFLPPTRQAQSNAG